MMERWDVEQQQQHIRMILSMIANASYYATRCVAIGPSSWFGLARSEFFHLLVNAKLLLTRVGRVSLRTTSRSFASRNISLHLSRSSRTIQVDTGCM